MRINQERRNFISTPASRSQHGYSCSQIFLTFFYLAIVGGLAYFLFFSSVFVINKINVSKLNLIDRTEIIKDTKDQKGKNILLLNTSPIKLDLLKKYPEIENVNIIKDLPSVLNIDIVEQKPSIVWRKGGDDYLLTGDGDIIEQGKTDAYKDYLVVFDQREVSLSKDKPVTSKKLIDFAKDIDANLKKTKLIKNYKFTTGNSQFELEVKTEKLRIIFNIIRDSSEQFRALKKVYKTANSQASEYIDLRIPGKVFYK